MMKNIVREVAMRKICALLLILTSICVLAGCKQESKTTDSIISKSEISADTNNQVDFDRENSLNQIREALETAEPWEIEIIVNILEEVGVRGVIRAEFVEQPYGNLPAVPVLEIESEDNRIYYIHMSGGRSHSIMTITDPEAGIIYSPISPMVD